MAAVSLIRSLISWSNSELEGPFVSASPKKNVVHEAWIETLATRQRRSDKRDLADSHSAVWVGNWTRACSPSNVASACSLPIRSLFNFALHGGDGRA